MVTASDPTNSLELEQKTARIPARAVSTLIARVVHTLLTTKRRERAAPSQCVYVYHAVVSRDMMWSTATVKLAIIHKCLAKTLVQKRTCVVVIPSSIVHDPHRNFTNGHRGHSRELPCARIHISHSKRSRRDFGEREPWQDNRRRFCTVSGKFLCHSVYKRSFYVSNC